MTALQLPTVTTESQLNLSNVYCPILGVGMNPGATPTFYISIGFYANKAAYLANVPPVDNARNFTLPNPVPQSAVDSVAINAQIDIFQLICALTIATVPMFANATIVS